MVGVVKWVLRRGQRGVMVVGIGRGRGGGSSKVVVGEVEKVINAEAVRNVHVHFLRERERELWKYRDGG